MPSFIDEFKHTKQKNDQLRRDLFNLAQKGDEDHTEIRLLRDVFDVPEAANKTIHNLNRNRNRNGDRDGYGYEDKGGNFRKFGISGEKGTSEKNLMKNLGGDYLPLRERVGNSNNIHKNEELKVDRDRFTELRQSIQEIKNSKYQLPKDMNPVEGEGEKDKKMYNSDNLLLCKLESKNNEIERLTEQINQLKLEKKRLSTKSSETEVLKLTLVKTHERELEKINSSWREKLIRERDANRVLYETVTKQSREIEELRREKLSLSSDLGQKLMFLKNEYKRVVKKVEEMEKIEESRINGSEINDHHLDNHPNDIIYNDRDYNNHHDDNYTDLHAEPYVPVCDESTTALINGYIGPLEKKNDELDSTTNFLINGNIQ